MAKINRHQGNMTPFASNASTANRYAFGTTTNSDELDSNLNPDYGQGWGAVAGGEDDVPVIQDFNALGFTTNKLIEYLFQSGIAEYDDEQTYYIDSVVTSGGKIYISLTDDNTGNDVTNLTHWNSTFDEDHEHSADDITSGVLATARIPDLNTSKTTAGVFDSDRIPDIDTDKIADDAITLAKMDAGTAGNLIAYNATGNPAAVATGTVGQVLTSGGVGVAPTMQDASTRGNTYIHTPIQTRTQGTYSVPSSGDGTEITPLTLTVTPNAAGNTMALEWVVNGESNGSDTSFIVSKDGTRLTDTTDGSNNRWACAVAIPYDGNNVDTPANIKIKMFDYSTLATETVYKLHIRASSTSARTFYLNRTVGSTGANSNEATLSTATAMEILV